MSGGQGYVGQRMSVNAANAYAEEKAPISKWTKAKLIEAILDVNWDLDEKLLKKLSKQSLIAEFPEYKEWHHTGKFYQITEFYGLRESEVEALTNEELKELIIKHTPTEKEKELARIKRAQVQARRAEKRREKQRIAELLELQQYSKYKSKVWFLRAYDGNTEGVEELKKRKKLEELSKEYRSLQGSIAQLRKYLKAKEMPRSEQTEKAMRFIKHMERRTSIKQRGLSALKTYVMEKEQRMKTVEKELECLNAL